MKASRRTFLKTVGGIGLFSIVPRNVLGGNGFVAPSDQLTKGIIGVGGIGRSSYHFTSSKECRLVSVCDVDNNHLQSAVKAAKERFGEDVKAYHDFRELINPDSLKVVEHAKVEPWLAQNAKVEDKFQFQRLGYFCVDPDTTADHLVFNRTISLKASWLKEQKKK